MELSRPAPGVRDRAMVPATLPERTRSGRALRDTRLARVRTLVIGTGGREHALALALSRDPSVTEVHAAPGNPGIGEVATLHPVDPLDGEAVADLAAELGADLVVIGPEAPLVAGVADAVRARGISCFGPIREAAALEGSKAFAKEVMAAAACPTALAHVCTTPEEVAAALDAFGAPYVVKDDGLAAGKGVVVTDDREAALAHAAQCERVVVEEYLDGPEVSLFAITDGHTVYPLQPAQDFKRIFDGDQGPNTGGMGAYTPLPWAPEGLVEEVLAPGAAADRRRDGPPRHAVRRAAVRRPRADLARGAGGRVQRRASATRRPSRCWRCSTRPLGALLKAAADGTLDEVAAAALEARRRGGRGDGRARLPGDVPQGRRDRRHRDPRPPRTDVDVIHAGTARDATAAWSPRAGGCSR